MRTLDIMNNSLVWALIAVVAIAGAVLGSRGLRGQVVPTHVIHLSDVPRVLRLTSSVGKDGTFSVFLVRSVPRGSDGVFPSVQFSVEDGRVGFDWVLTSRRNVTDQSRFEALAKSLGYSPRLREMNNVKYVRVENGDLAALCREVLVQLFGVDEKSQLGLIVEGVKWP